LGREQINPLWIEAGGESGRARDGELGRVSKAKPHGEGLDGDGGGDDELGARGAFLALADYSRCQIVLERQRHRFLDAARWLGRFQGALPHPLSKILTLKNPRPETTALYAQIKFVVGSRLNCALPFEELNIAMGFLHGWKFKRKYSCL
jgi:hypothetical protein